MSSPSRSQFKRTNNYYLVVAQVNQHIHYIDVDANEWSGLNYVRLVGFNNLVSLSLNFENGKGNSSDLCIALDRLPTLMHLYVKFNSSRSHNNKYLTSSNYHQRKPTQLKTLQLINFNPLTGSDIRVLMHKVPQATISMIGYDYYWTPSPVTVKGLSASLVKEFARYLCESKRLYLQVYYRPQQSQNSLLAYEYMRGNTVTALSIRYTEEANESNMKLWTLNIEAKLTQMQMDIFLQSAKDYEPLDYIHVHLENCQHDINVVASTVCGKSYQTRQTVIIENGYFQNERVEIRVDESIEQLIFKSCIFVRGTDGVVATYATNIEYEQDCLIYESV